MMLLVLAGQVLFLVILSVMGVYFLYQIFYFRYAPYVATRKDVVDAMISMAELKEGMRVLELGSGNGELCIRAAELGATSLGMETNPTLILLSRYRARRRGVANRAAFIRHNFFKTAFPRETDVVFVYLLPKTMDLLLPKLKRELKPGTVIISNAFVFTGIMPEKRAGKVIKYRLSSAS